jgi:hypothetical protein
MFVSAILASYYAKFLILDRGQSDGLFMINNALELFCGEQPDEQPLLESQRGGFKTVFINGLASSYVLFKNFKFQKFLVVCFMAK